MEQEISAEQTAAIRERVGSIIKEHGITLDQLAGIISAMRTDSVSVETQQNFSGNDVSDLYRKCVLSEMQYGNMEFFNQIRKKFTDGSIDRKKDLSIKISAKELIESSKADNMRIASRLRSLKAFLERHESSVRNHVIISGSEEERVRLVGIEPNALNSDVKFEVTE